MQNYYSEFSEEIKKFKEEIYFYCDYNLDCKVLFPLFVSLWPEKDGGLEEKDISRKDLAVLTSHILNDLTERGVLEIVDKNALNGYAFYKILPHKDLVDHISFIDKKRGLKFS
jgi:hypothetical protein